MIFSLMYFCILILPFLSFLSCCCFGRFIGINGSCFLSTTAIFSSFVLSLFAFYETAILGSNCEIFLSHWIASELLVIN
jgi:NADH:ubiquinone oxidoreductase subunit 5 (subunit L)/multisubunit Na+/H+ antiporter MnhA subunit